VTLANLDELSPRYLGEDRIGLELAAEQNPIAGRSVSIVVDYTALAPYGAELPLEMIVQASAPESYQRRVFSRLRPTALIFIPREGGTHSVVLRELGHNRWWGKLRIGVAGELLEATT
jgi:hypothetical protein